LRAVEPFALTCAALQDSAWPECDHMLADANGDGVVNVLDIDPILELLMGDR
jgi:hypothetical protein